jgi:hypothetical protein
MPLFVREGAIVPMLLTEVQTLCDANYVNNPPVKTPDRGLLFLMYPGSISRFTVYDGTAIQCQVERAATIVTLSSAARPVVLQILADEPVMVTRDDTALPQRATPAEFEAADTGWRFDASARLLLIKFQHPGGTTQINFSRMASRSQRL